jgi:tRNA-Thr(GGU) m(6)t(6)A37 methyltransferase TsaA
MTIEIESIGYVVADRQDPEDDFWGETESCIELTGSFQSDALDGIDSFSHVEILFLFHQVMPEKIVAGARHPRNNPDWPSVGIFAQRGKNRPNRIGSTICRLVYRDATRLYVAELDAIQGTPVIDIKPVMTEFLPRGEIIQPQWSRELMRQYWQKAMP